MRSPTEVINNPFTEGAHYPSPNSDFFFLLFSFQTSPGVIAALCLNPSLSWISVVTVPKRAHQHPKRRSEPRMIDSTVILMTRLSLTMNSQSLLAEAAGSYFQATVTDPRKQLYPGLMRDGIFPILWDVSSHICPGKSPQTVLVTLLCKWTNVVSFSCI